MTAKMPQSPIQSLPPEEFYRLLVEGVRDYAIYMLDESGLISSWNLGAERLKQYSASEVIGQHFGMFYTDDDRRTQMPYRALEIAEREEKYEAEGWRVRKDGTRFWANVVIDAVRDPTGKLIGFAKITRDVTERRENQIALEKTREHLAQAQKMEALGQLTGGIAHDFNNLLMIVSGQAQRLRRKISDKKLREAIDSISAAADRGATLTRRLLTFARNQHLQPTIINFTEQLESLRGLLSSSLRGNIELMTVVPNDIWPVQVDPSELELALINIAVNARDAMQDGGQFIMTVANTPLGADDHIEDLSGAYVAIALTDTGTGIPAESLVKVFEPFYTTKDVGKGTGLGLAQVHGFAHQAGGAVTISSRTAPDPAQGTTITIYLPRSEATAAPQAIAPQIQAPEKTEGRVLLVEDDPNVGEVTKAMLEELGCRVIFVPSAAEALKVLESGAPVDLLFSDIVMPEISGLTLAEQVSARYPRLSILLASGYSDALKTETRFKVLRKPFHLAALEMELGNILKRA